MTGRHRARDLRAFDHDDAEVLARIPRDLERAIVVRGNIFFKRLVFDVVGDGDDIETFAPGFLGANGGPDQAVRENGVDVEVAFQRYEARNVREVHFGARAGDGLMGEG